MELDGRLSLTKEQWMAKSSIPLRMAPFFNEILHQFVQRKLRS
jgi:hypothetical protein